MPIRENAMTAAAAAVPGRPFVANSAPEAYLGCLDNMEGTVLRGWCCRRDSAEAVEVEVFGDDVKLGTFAADTYRQDLCDAGLYKGAHAFNIDLAPFHVHFLTKISARPAGHGSAILHSGQTVQELRKLNSQGKPAAENIKIIMMLKNEDDLIMPWIKFHGSLVGYENLIILDNGSTSERTLTVLKWGAKQGAIVDRQYATQSDFVGRGKIYVDIIQKMDAEGGADFYIPLDCDEFVAVSRGEGVDCGDAALAAELSSYVECPSPLAIFAGLDNHPRKPGFFRWSPNQKKTFFAAGACAFLDHGFHAGCSRLGGDPIRTRLVYLHYHYKPYELLVEHAKAKLLPFTTDFSSGNMRRYVDGKKDAWHCAAHILRSKGEYLESFHDGAFAEFPEIRERFTSLGEPLPFSGGPRRGSGTAGTWL